MKTKGTKVYEINGTEMQFDRDAFNQAFLYYSRTLHKKIGDTEKALAEELSVSTETIRNWRKGTNGPGSTELIEEAAKVLSVSDWITLFQTTDGGEKSEMNEKQIESVKRFMMYVSKRSGDSYILRMYGRCCTNMNSGRR